MKTPFLLIALLTSMTLPAHSQLLGIFQQGAQELKESGQQIAALELLLTRQHTGYQIFESGLTSISTITRNELSLHQNYYSRLSSVNPAIARSTIVTDCLTLQITILSTLSSALQRWQTSPSLTSRDLAYISRLTKTLTSAASALLTYLNLLLNINNLTITDSERLAQIREVYREFTSLSATAKAFVSSTDILILNRTP